MIVSEVVISVLGHLLFQNVVKRLLLWRFDTEQYQNEYKLWPMPYIEYRAYYVWPKYSTDLA